MHFLGGFLPFSSISVELYYVFATVWGRQHYTLYGILFLVFIILLAGTLCRLLWTISNATSTVTVCSSVALTYFQLSKEDHRWWWRSIFSSGYVLHGWTRAHAVAQGNRAVCVCLRNILLYGALQHVWPTTGTQLHMSYYTPIDCTCRRSSSLATPF